MQLKCCALLVLVLLATTCLLIEAAPEKSRLGQKSRAKNQQELDVKQQEQDVKIQGNAAAGSGAGAKDPSSGRLFLKKFLTFKNLFSSSNQPVIPIIITGAGSPTSTATGTASPTVTVTSTGTIPSATGTITTSPTSPTTTATSRSQQVMAYGANQGQIDDDEEEDQEQEQEQMQVQKVQQPAAAYPAELMDEQALQAALAAGAQEYEVVTDEEVQGTGPGESKATQSNHINLRRKGARRGQVISVRIPQRYRRYFKNGQKVMLNTGSRPLNKRRVVRKRLPSKKLNNRRRTGGNKKNRKNRNKNRRTRITAV
ncbi:hypothetical protein KR009_008498 [Drosophila setifemur]|nr:hypothetical protein KR009_008498 [Drosophila setifemur]